MIVTVVIEGQLISKRLLVPSILPKNERKKIRLYYDGTSSQIVFVRFLGELKTPKRNYEIN